MVEFSVDRDHYRAFHTFLEKFATLLVDTVDGTRRMIGIRKTAAGAVKPCPAISALLAGIYVALEEFFADLLILYTVPYISEKELLVTYELVARVQIAPWSNRHIFGSRTAS